MEPTKSDHLTDADLALRGLSRETDIRLDPRGRFFAGEQPITHPGVVDAFSRWLSRTEAGRYALRNELHYVYVTVEGAPLHARRADVAEGGSGATLRLQGGEREALDPATLRQGPDGALYAVVRGDWVVRLAPEAVLDLEPVLEEEGGATVVRLAGRRHAIPAREDPLAP